MEVPDSYLNNFSFNTQPPEGGWDPHFFGFFFDFSFNTQPPEGGWGKTLSVVSDLAKFQHTAARRRLGIPSPVTDLDVMFQHTAARRRLV